MIPVGLRLSDKEGLRRDHEARVEDLAFQLPLQLGQHLTGTAAHIRDGAARQFVLADHVDLLSFPQRVSLVPIGMFIRVATVWVTGRRNLIGHFRIGGRNSPLRFSIKKRFVWLP